MGYRDGITARRFNDFDERHAIYKDAAWLKRDGWSNRQIGSAYGVSEATVAQWLVYARARATAEARPVRLTVARARRSR